MTNYHDTLSRINYALSVLAFQVRSDVNAGLTARNKLAEDMLLPVLRRVYQSPQLANTSQNATNFPGIDLFDPVTGQGIQITSETGADKITDTLRTIVDSNIPIKRLAIVLITESKPNYRRVSRNRWIQIAASRFKFDPNSGIMTLYDLFAQVVRLPPAQIEEVANELDRLIHGKSELHLVAFIAEQAHRQLAIEKTTGKYIPDVFVETVATKYHCRCFAHPVLFFPRIAEWMNNQPFWAFNRLAHKAGVPVVDEPAAVDTARIGTVARAVALSTVAAEELRQRHEHLAEYRELSSRKQPPWQLVPGHKHVYDEVRFYVTNGAYGLQRILASRLQELECVQKPVFLLVGRAGQGKTNFICDFVERFLLRHEIPCAYLTGRQLSRIPGPDLTETVRRFVFPASVTSFDEGMRIVTDECIRIGKPFLLIIDGLNEHPDMARFAGQLEHLLLQMTRYPNARALLTCRSEFFQERFGGLLEGELGPFVYKAEAHGYRLEDDEFDELIARYFDFFDIQSERISRVVVGSLRNDVLLLRFFCEAYGARGRDTGYVQPRITRVYRDAIFEEYLRRKIESAEQIVADIVGRPRPTRAGGLQRVLMNIIEYMVCHAQYSDIAAHVVPRELDDAFYALLDEELVLRRDPGPVGSVLEEPTEVINFTFDELRDYLIAQYLVLEARKDPDCFNEHVNAQRPSSTQSLEGVRRFLFYAARDPRNAEFLRMYEKHPWYSAVYDTEVFELRPEYLDQRDREAVLRMLSEGGEPARRTVVELAVRWHTPDWPVLNLELLLEVVSRGEAQFWNDVFFPAFAERRSFDQSTLNEEFCKFMERKLSDWKPEYAELLRALGKLLVLLLPVQAGITLESPAVQTFRQLAVVAPAFALDVLQGGLDNRLHAQQPFVWRLLGELALRIENSAILSSQAEHLVGRLDVDLPIRREAARFLERIRDRI